MRYNSAVDRWRGLIAREQPQINSDLPEEYA
jgi:hypothetical protein